MVISSFITSVLVLALGIWAYMKLESSMNIVAEKQLLIEPSRFSYKMWKDMPVTMYQSFTFFNLTNWNQVKSIGQKPRFVEVGPYVYRTIWTKSDINFMDEERLVSFAEKKQWIFQPHLSKGFEDDQIWTINTPLMTALALIQNAPVITRNIVSVILDGLGEGAFIKRNIRSLLFEGYSDLIVSVGPLFDRRFSNFNGKFAYLYNKNDSVDGIWTVSTGTEDMSTLNKITRFQSNIVNITSFSSGQLPQGLNEVKAECAPAWSLDQSTNGQLFSPFNRDVEQLKLQQQLQQIKAAALAANNKNGRLDARSVPNSSNTDQMIPSPSSTSSSSSTSPAKRFFSRSATNHHDYNHQQHHHPQHHQDLVPNPFINQKTYDLNGRQSTALSQQQQLQQLQQQHNENNKNNPSSSQEKAQQLKDVGKFIFYPDLCRPIHLLPSKQEVSTSNGIQASRYFIDPRVFMNSTQVPTNRCYEMNPRPPLANALAATINSVTGANVAMPSLVTSASSPFAMFSPPNNHHHIDNNNAGGLFERSNNHPTSSFLNNALHTFSGAASGANGGALGGLIGNQDQLASSSNNAPISRLGRVRQLFSNIVSQRMSAGPGSLLPTLAAGPAGMLIGNHFQTSSLNARNSPDELPVPSLLGHNGLPRQSILQQNGQHLDASGRLAANSNLDGLQSMPNHPVPAQTNAPAGGSDRWITQFRFKWPKGVFSIGQCQLGAPIYASLPHFLDADEYYLEQVDGLKPNRSLHEFYIDIESTLHSVPVGAKARLQLNVATPELRFRNIPNAMIPVLWQEVTFDIDKPIATMLYWSFTMSATIYKLISFLLLASGLILMIVSFIGGFKQHKDRLRKNRIVCDSVDTVETDATSATSSRSSVGCSSAASSVAQLANDTNSTRQEGQRSSWRPQMLHNDLRVALSQRTTKQQPSSSHLNTNNNTSNNNNNNNNSNSNNNETLVDDIRHGAALNHAFSLCTEFNDRLSDHGGRHCQSHHPESGPSSASTTNGSPKQPSSRASSHCELVSSVGTTTIGANSTNSCLLACLRHSPNNINNHFNTNHKHHHHQRHNIHDVVHHHQLTGTSDNSLVIQQVSTSDIDKATTPLSSRESNLDSCGSIYTTAHQRIRIFKQ